MPEAAAMGRRFAAIPNIDIGLSPRHFLGSPPQQLRERQDIFVCPKPNSHRCDDTGFPNDCCLDTEFCFVDNNFNSSCCAIGNNCASVNICTDTAFFYCHTTSTITAATTSPTRSVSSGSSITSPPNPNITVFPACCPRPCSAASAYQCPESLGGGCCSLGYSCLSNACYKSIPTTSSTTSCAVPSCPTSSRSPSPTTLLRHRLRGPYRAAHRRYFREQRNRETSRRGRLEQRRESGNRRGCSDWGVTGDRGGGVVVDLKAPTGRWECTAGKWARERAMGECAWRDGNGGLDAAREYAWGADMAGRGTEDYFGPTAGIGPFTGAEGAGAARSGAVPVSPNQPGDIQPAVEIGEALGRRTPVSPGPSTQHEYWKHGAKTVNEHVELE
ncbi:hypothetical protein VE04_04191 [Pseudogymnoascus sp. 24MN13]|nr:hypothetical protein VE04_04191 [Pseudogymnoascus sp. 24MN13]